MVQRFEDLIAWQQARTLTTRVYLATSEGRFARDFGLAGQLQRASVSVMANLAEGFDRNRMTEFARFIEISRGSAAEVLSHLYVARDIGYISEGQFDELAGTTRNVTRLLTALLDSVRRKLRDQPARLAEEVTEYDLDLTAQPGTPSHLDNWVSVASTGTGHVAQSTGH